MNFELRNELTGRTLERNFKYYTIRTSRETYRLSHEKKKQFREFLTAVKGILCTRLIYLRLQNNRLLGHLCYNDVIKKFAL